jgi:hypothetical protein
MPILVRAPLQDYRGRFARGHAGAWKATFYVLGCPLAIKCAHAATAQHAGELWT